MMLDNIDFISVPKRFVGLAMCFVEGCFMITSPPSLGQFYNYRTGLESIVKSTQMPDYY